VSDGTKKRELVGALLAEQPLAVLSTYGPAGPHASLVALAATDDLTAVLFVTARHTRKFTNLTDEPRVALLVDSRTNDGTDFEQASAVTIAGRATEVREADRPALLAVYTARHPSLREFAESPACALIEVRVDAYQIVTHFEDVMEWLP